NELHMWLEKVKTQKLDQAKWPFTSKETQGKLLKMEQYKTTFTLALTINTSYSPMDESPLNFVSRHDVKKAGALLEEEKKSKIYEWLSQGSFNATHETQKEY